MEIVERVLRLRPVVDQDSGYRNLPKAPGTPTLGPADADDSETDLFDLPIKSGHRYSFRSHKRVGTCAGQSLFYYVSLFESCVWKVLFCVLIFLFFCVLDSHLFSLSRT